MALATPHPAVPCLAAPTDQRARPRLACSCTCERPTATTR